MSNIGNIFGNEGWIQSSIDRSRGKTRPGPKRRKAAKRDAARRKALLEKDPLYRKEMGLPPLKVTPGLSSAIQRGILRAQSGT